MNLQSLIHRGTTSDPGANGAATASTCRWNVRSWQRGAQGPKPGNGWMLPGGSILVPVNSVSAQDGAEGGCGLRGAVRGSAAPDVASPTALAMGSSLITLPARSPWPCACRIRNH